MYVAESCLGAFPGLSNFGGFGAAATIALILGTTLVLLMTIPKKIRNSYRRLTRDAEGKRNITRELSVFSIGDEPSLIFSALNLMQRLALVVVWALGLCAVFHVFKFGHVVLVRSVELSAEIAGLAYAVLSIFFYGVTQGLIALDSSVAVTPAPRGVCEIVILPSEKRGALFHSSLFESPKALSALADSLESRI